MADACKDEGNALYKSKEWLKAAAAYTKGIKADPNHHVLYRCVRGTPARPGGRRMPPRSQTHRLGTTVRGLVLRDDAKT
jgi:hypothetical protein